jgi:SAM-dependent methyltransferase
MSFRFLWLFPQKTFTGRQDIYMKTKNNPWLDIQIEDYEKHMAAPSVIQLQMLDTIFEEVLDKSSPASVCVLGCTAGNGFQHLINRNLKRVVGIDINQIYLAECRAWFIEDVPNLELICADLNEFDLNEDVFDLIHAALIFEYVEVGPVLAKIHKWLKPGGILSVVLQIPSELSSPVSETNCVPLQRLSSLMHLIKPADFKDIASENGLMELGSKEIELKKGKSFYAGIYEQLQNN